MGTEAEALSQELHDAIIRSAGKNEQETALALAVAGLVGNIAKSLERLANRFDAVTDVHRHTSISVTEVER